MNDAPKRLGLLTAGEAPTALLYHHLLHEEIHLRTRGSHSVRLITEALDSAGFPPGRVAPGAGRELCAAAKRLERHGAEAILLGSSRLHHQAELVEAAVTVPVLSIARATAVKVQRLQLNPVAFLGLEDRDRSLWTAELAAAGTKLVLPKKLDAGFVADQLARGLTAETATAQVRAAFTRLSVDLRLAGARLIVLTRPELAFGLREADAELPTLCAVQAHCKYAARFAMHEQTLTGQARK